MRPSTEIRLPRTGELISREKLAAVLIDMQPAFVYRLEPNERKKLIAGQLQVIKDCALYDIPLIVIELRRWWKFGWTIRALRRASKKVPRVMTLRKRHNNAFNETVLLQQLEAFDVRHLVVMGLNMSVCVKETCQTAREEYGFGIITADNLISCISPPAREVHRSWYDVWGRVYTRMPPLTELLENPYPQ